MNTIRIAITIARFRWVMARRLSGTVVVWSRA